MKEKIYQKRKKQICMKGSSQYDLNVEESCVSNCITVLWLVVLCSWSVNPSDLIFISV